MTYDQGFRILESETDDVKMRVTITGTRGETNSDVMYGRQIAESARLIPELVSQGKIVTIENPAHGITVRYEPF